MILSDIKDYLSRRGQATLTDIANHFHAEPEAVRGMLDYWMRKGKVEKRMATASCGTSCSKCDAATAEIYFWRDNPQHAGEKTIHFVPDVCDQS